METYKSQIRARTSVGQGSYLITEMFDLNINFPRMMMADISYKECSCLIKHQTQVTWIFTGMENQIPLHHDKNLPWREVLDSAG